MAKRRKLGRIARFRMTFRLHCELDDLVAAALHCEGQPRPGTRELATIIRSSTDLMALASDLASSHQSLTEIFASERYVRLGITGQRAQHHRVRDAIRRTHFDIVERQLTNPMAPVPAFA